MDSAHGRDVLPFLNLLDTCRICLDPFSQSGESMVSLPCKHVIGHRCLFKWLDSWNTSSATCILCRRNPFFAVNQTYSFPYRFRREPLIHSWTTSSLRTLASGLPSLRSPGASNVDLVWEWGVEDLTTRCPRQAMWALVYKYLCSFPPDVNIRRFIHSPDNIGDHDGLNSTLTTLLTRLNQDEKSAKKHKLCVGHIITLKRMLRYEIWRRQHFSLDVRSRKLRNMRDAIRLAVMQTPHLTLSFSERFALVCTVGGSEDLNIIPEDPLVKTEANDRWEQAARVMHGLREYWRSCCANLDVEVDDRVFEALFWELYSCPKAEGQSGEEQVVYVQYKRRMYAYCPVASSLERNAEGDMSTADSMAGASSEEPLVGGLSHDAADLSAPMSSPLSKWPGSQGLSVTEDIDRSPSSKGRPRSNALLSTPRASGHKHHSQTGNEKGCHPPGRSLASLARSLLSIMCACGLSRISTLRPLTILLSRTL